MGVHLRAVSGEGRKRMTMFSGIIKEVKR